MLFELPVPPPPETLDESCDPEAVLPMFALPVPSPPPVALPAALPLVPVVPAPDPSVSLPVPIALEVVPVVDEPAAVLVVDDPPAPSVELRLLPDPPLLETPAPLPAEPPLSAEFDAPLVDELSPEFSLVCDPADEFADDAVCCASFLPPWTSVPA